MWLYSPVIVKFFIGEILAIGNHMNLRYKRFCVSLINGINAKILKFYLSKISSTYFKILKLKEKLFRKR